MREFGHKEKKSFSPIFISSLLLAEAAAIGKPSYTLFNSLSISLFRFEAQRFSLVPQNAYTTISISIESLINLRRSLLHFRATQHFFRLSYFYLFISFILRNLVTFFLSHCRNIEFCHDL